MESKRCFKCLCTKPLSLFYKHAAMGDGRLNKCIECTKADAKLHRQANLERVRAYDRLRGSAPHRVAARMQYQKSAAYAQSHAASAKRWADAHPERRRASYAVNNAIRGGRLTPWPVCSVPECESKPEAHHSDYSRPLNVSWLCRKHHAAAHKLTAEIDRQTTAKQ